MDAFGVGGIKERREIFRWGVLCLGAVVWLDPGMRCVLGAVWAWMLKTLEGSLDVTGDRDVASAIDVVENEGETTVLFGGPINGSFLEGSQGGQEVVGIGLVGVRCAEVVDNEGESEGSCAVFPETRSDRDRGIAVRRQEVD